MRYSLSTATDRYAAALAALRPLATLDPTLRLRRSLARGFARALLPANPARLRYAFEELLGEPPASARRLLFDWFFYRQLETASWRGTPVAHAGARLIDARAVGQYVDACKRGVVVATIHLGDYLEGLRQLRRALTRRRAVLVVRRVGWSGLEQRAFDRVVGKEFDLEVLRHGPGAATCAIRALRGGALVIALYDVPARFGRTVAVDFFGHGANLVRGPAEIALLGDADILPLFTHYDADGVSITEALPVIAARVASLSERRGRIAEITQRLCTLAERHIRRDPAQWAHWTLLDELFERPRGPAADVESLSAR